MTNPAAPPSYWSSSGEAVLAALQSRREGLSSAEAMARLRRDGANRVAETRELSIISLLARQFSNPLVLILVFAAVIAASVGEWIDAGIVVAIVLGSALLGFSQEYRASNAVADLRRRLALVAKVRRDGAIVSIPVEEVVVGDVIALSAGALVPADAVLLETNELQVTEALLTGEPFPVEKRPGPVPPEASVPQRLNCVFVGASVRSGAGEAVVVATGAGTLFGKVAERLKAKPEDTDFTRGIRRLGALLIRMMILLVLFVLAVNHLGGRPFVDSLLFAVALGVGMSPELLPAIISVTLSAGAGALAKRGVVVRRLDAIENLGAMTVFCTDKTGTLTEGRIKLEATLLPNGSASPDVARLGYLNAAFETWTRRSSRRAGGSACPPQASSRCRRFPTISVASGSRSSWLLKAASAGSSRRAPSTRSWRHARLWRTSGARRPSAHRSSNACAPSTQRRARRA
jgi:Mg2+-importing ATPase